MTGTDQSGTDQSGTDQSGTDQSGTDQTRSAGFAPPDENQLAASDARAQHAMLRYNTLRLAIFVVALAVLWLVRVKGLLLVALAFLVSGLASYVFLRGQRDAMLAQISRGLDRRRQRAAVREAREDHLQGDRDEDHEEGDA